MFEQLRFRMNSLRIRTKLMALGIGCVLMTALAMVLVGIWQGSIFERQALVEAQKLIDADLDHIVENVYNLIEGQNESIQQKVNHDLNVARYALDNEGGISLSAETVTWKATNQYSGESVQVTLPKMIVGDRGLEKIDQMWVETPVVDLVKRLVGGTATIFQRMNSQGDMLRVATNVENADGTRAIGTYIPAVNPDGSPNPVVSTTIRGETYRGIAYVVNAWYVTAYEPILDARGEMIGVLYVGVRQENIDSLRQGILQVRIGQTGYVFVLGGKGDLRGHYIISKDGRRDGEDIWGVTDTEGRPIIKSIVQKALRLGPGQFDTERYLWQNPEDPVPRMKIARLAYYKPWDWVIGASVYEDELQGFIAPLKAGYRSMIWIFGAVALILAVVGGIVTWFASRKIADPLILVTRAAKRLTRQDLPRLVNTMQAADRGDLTVSFRFEPEPIHVTAGDEVGTMAQAFTSVNESLVSVGRAFTQMVANLRDLTEGLEARVAERTAEISESERRLSDIIDFLPHATFVINRSGEVIAWNRAIEQMTGIRAAEMLGKGGYAYAVPFYGEPRPILIDLVLDQPEGHEKRYANLKRDGQVLTGESFLRLASGGRFYAVASASALYDAQGKVAGAIEIIRDETERKALETELLKAKEKAEEATRAKSNFLANMSHEIRTPMNAIIGFIELSLEDTRLPKSLRGHMETAFRSARSLLGLINDILDVSKVESGKLELEIRPFRLRAMLEDIVKVMRVKAEEKGLALDLVLPPAVDKGYWGDAFRIRQVLMNLVGNAVKFTDRGEITVGVEPVAGEGDVLHFKVADTGIGIPADRIDRVFESFTQADGSISRRYGGTGLGTTISRQLVELMGGRIWAESTHGEGSVFQFTLPLKPAAADFEDVEALSGTDGSSGTGRCFHVLLAEDVEENITLARHRLEKQGHSVTVARNGREAVAAIENGGIDLVLMDVQMPVMDGLEATRRIRQMETGRSVRTPIIALTASVMKVERSQCMDAGMDMIAGKPVNFPRLFAAMEKLVPTGGGQECVPPQNGISEEADFPSLAGVDTGRGLETWGDKAAYATALRAFARNHGDAADRMAAALSAGDVPGAIQEAHKLKGIAGNLALTAVSSVVATLYAALHEKRIAQARELTASLAKAVAEVTAAIGQLSAVTVDTAPEPKAFDSQQVATLLEDLLRDLKKSNPYAVEPLIDRLGEYLSASELEPVTAKIDQFDFPGAEEAVFRIAGNLNLRLGA